MLDEWLHQPESYHAIKLYAEFGFELLTDPVIGLMENDVEECLPFLKAHMPGKDFSSLKTTQTPASFIERIAQFDTSQFWPNRRIVWKPCCFTEK